MSEEVGLFGEEAETVPVVTEVVTPPAAPVVEAAPEAPKGDKEVAPPATERSRDESGRFTKTDDEHMVPLSALLSERERRQAAEAQAKAVQPPKPVPDVWVDPAAFIQHELEARTPDILAKAGVAAREQFFNYTENSARSRHAKDSLPYDTARDAFIDEAQRNPVMQSKLRDAPDPGEFIYQQGKIALELKEVGGDLSAYRTRIETEVRQKLEKEAAERQTRNQNIPVSLNSEPSKGAGVQGSSAWAGPTPDDILFPER